MFTDFFEGKGGTIPGAVVSGAQGAKFSDIGHCYMHKKIQVSYLFIYLFVRGTPPKLLNGFSRNLVYNSCSVVREIVYMQFVRGSAE